MMKISKLFKVGAFALLAASLCFVGCKNDDDENSVIQGSGNNKSIDYYNDGTTDGICRGYSTTALKHQGELVRFTLKGSNGTTTKDYSNYADKTYGGVMGFMWDLSIADAGDETSKRDFFVVGLSVGSDGSDTTKVKYYVSRYFNVKNIYAKNFGVENQVTSTSDSKITEEKVCELDLTKTIGGETFKELCSTAAENLVIWADIYPTLVAGKTHTQGKEDSKSDYTGGWTIDFYEGTAGSNEVGQKIDTFTIAPTYTGYAAGTAATGTKIPQNYMACYANVYNGKRVTGEWYLKSDYFADNIVEE